MTRVANLPPNSVAGIGEASATDDAPHVWQNACRPICQLLLRRSRFCCCVLDWPHDRVTTFAVAIR